MAVTFADHGDLRLPAPKGDHVLLWDWRRSRCGGQGSWLPGTGNGKHSATAYVISRTGKGREIGMVTYLTVSYSAL
ncbi:hypothetical protein Ga0074812_1222 [Parafrankia irregularis]|uniref:Uncharacterized protein n=1 Tax=Parafrankia irregularis TaxID=795642 RepID=A0A0S4QT15_9ACTN|nr:hypothetical protein Ga0074812_1222 [Parafrankia irregularis]